MPGPKPKHTTGGSGRGERRGGRLGSSRTARRPNSSLRRQTSVEPQASSKRRLNVSSEARTSETLCKSNAGTRSAVDKRLIRGLTAEREALFVLGCRPVDGRLFVSVSAFHIRYVRHLYNYLTGNNNDYLSNPEPGYTTGGSVRAAHGEADGRSGLGREERRRVLFAQDTKVSRNIQIIDKSCVLHISSTNKRNSICRVLNSDMPRAGRVEAHDEAAGRGLSGIDTDSTVR